MAPIELLTSLARSILDGARVRPYGIEVADLDIDFDAPRAFVTTRVLAACLHCDEAAAWDLAIQTRILLLLGISELSLADPIEAHLGCSCGETAVIELGMDELAQFAADRRRGELAVGGVRLRLPTGRDQLRWAQLDPERGDVARSVLSDLVLEGGLTDELVVAADALLTDADPLIDLQLESTCPGCRAALARTIDLERIAQTRLRHARRILLEQVDAIASMYHWPEATIATLPAWRRAEYAALAAGRRR